jgi:dTDP-D-glucose 4,6-dehydratase
MKSVVFGGAGFIDVARGILAVLEKGVPGTAYNVATGKGRSNIDVLKNNACPSSERLRAASGWRPSVLSRSK